MDTLTDIPDIKGKVACLHNISCKSNRQSISTCIVCISKHKRGKETKLVTSILYMLIRKASCYNDFNEIFAATETKRGVWFHTEFV